MRKRTWVALGCFVLALALAVPTSRSDGKALATLFGILVLLALGAGIAMLPFWSRVPRLPRMPGLFERGDGPWCAACGRHGLGACPHGSPVRPRRQAAASGNASTGGATLSAPPSAAAGRLPTSRTRR